MTIRPFLILILALSVSLPAWAQGKAATATPLTRLDAATEKMLKGLSENQTRQFAAIRNSHGILQSVSDVEDHMGKAVRSCATKHPNLADHIENRYIDWKKGLSPIISDAKQRQKKMISMQNFATQAEVKNYLKQVDEAVAYKSRGVTYIPIDSEKECKRLISKMDGSEENLKKLLVRSLNLEKDLLLKEK